MKAIGYLRVSTLSQAKEGVSLDAQRAKIRSWADANGYELVAIHEDAGISGGKAENRPGLQAALVDSCRNGAALVVYSLSRLARSTKDAIAISDRLSKCGADLVSLSERIDTTSASGKMIFRLMAVLAEFERDQISERTREAMKHLKHQGRRVGAVPFGFQVNSSGQLAKDPREQRIMERMIALKASGLSYAKLAMYLNEQRTPSKENGRWHTASVFAVLNR